MISFSLSQSYTSKVLSNSDYFIEIHIYWANKAELCVGRLILLWIRLFVRRYGSVLLVISDLLSYLSP